MKGHKGVGVGGVSVDFVALSVAKKKAWPLFEVAVGVARETGPSEPG